MPKTSNGIAGLGQRIASARMGRNMTQLDLARATGLKPSAVSHFEVGERRPSCANLFKLAKALAVTSDHLIGL